MKTKLILMSLGVLFSLSVMGQNTTSSKAWDYPVKPGTEQWKALKGLPEKLEVTQIPESVLKTVSTEDLVDLCMNYPLRFNYFAYNTLKEGVVTVAEQFNGLKELFARHDNAKAIFKALEKENENSALMLSADAVAQHTFDQSLLEMFLAQDVVLANANAELKAEISTTAFKSMMMKNSQLATYTTYCLGTSAYLLAKGLNSVDERVSESAPLKTFLSDGSLRNMKIIDELGSQFL